MARPEDDVALSVLRAFTILHEPEIHARARRIVDARQVIAGDGYRSHSNPPELHDAAIGSCAAALIDVLVAQASLTGRSTR